MNTNKPGGHGDQSIQRLMGKAAEAETKLEAEHEAGHTTVGNTSV